MRLIVIGAVAFVLVPLGDGVSAQWAAGRQVALVIGREDGSANEVFPFIGDVEATSTGDVLVLDRMGKDIAWFDANGIAVQRFGRAGRGPGEFGELQGMTVDDSDRVHVNDVGNRRISIYRLLDGRVQHVGDQRVLGLYNDICALGSRRFVVAAESDDVVHELDGEGRVRRSFGDPERASPETSRRVSNAAKLRIFL